jgi:hypothetical protein
MQPDDMPNAAKREMGVFCLTGNEVDRPGHVINARVSRCIAKPTRKGLASVAFLAG